MPASAIKTSLPRLSAAEKMTERLKCYSSLRPDQVPEYVKAFKRMIEEYGESRVNEAVTRAIDAIPAFPPTPAEIRKHMPSDQVVTCGYCDNGWVIVNPEAKSSERIVRRCECLQR